MRLREPGGLEAVDHVHYLPAFSEGLGESVLSVKISASVNTGGCRVVMPEGRSDAPARCGVRCAVSRYVNDWPYRRR